MAEKSLKNLLVIEDNIGDARFIKEMLRDTDFAQYELTYVNSLDALVVFKKTRFEAIFLDLHLSHIKPIDTFNIVNSLFPRTPIIVLTGINDDKLAASIVRHGAQDYIIKGTFDSDSLQRSLKYSMYRKKAERQLASEKNRASEMKRKADSFETESKRLVKINKAKDVFLSIASHQLRTPATAVKQYISMALDGYAGDISPELKSFLETAYQSNERQLKIVNDLLNVARLDAGHVTLHKELTDICALIREITKDCADIFAAKKQSLSLRLANEAIMAHVDVGNIRMVFENLIDNASKYSDENSHIEVTVFKKDKHVYCKIRDQGIGISPSDQKKLFHKFSRADNSFTYSPNGSGLGLYWARELIKLHGGSIELISQPGKGSTFTIQLPV